MRACLIAAEAWVDCQGFNPSPQLRGNRRPPGADQGFNSRNCLWRAAVPCSLQLWYAYFADWTLARVARSWHSLDS